MATVLHIDGLSGRSRDHYVKLGQSYLDAFKEMEATVRVEHVPDPPRKLDPRAECFIAEYEREEAGSVLAVFWRYSSLEAEEFDTAEEAERFLEGGEEYGSLAGEAIVYGDKITVLD